MGIWSRTKDGVDLAGLVHHSNRGVQYRAVRYVERLHHRESGLVGTKGDSYENAMAEALSSLFKVELVPNGVPGGTSTISCLPWPSGDWYIHRRLRGKRDHATPAEFTQHPVSEPQPAAFPNRARSTKPGE